MIGGLIPKKVNASVEVSWQWYDQPQGLVEWTFINNASVAQSGLLFRNNYPFGNAFWPMYEDNPKEFGTGFTNIIVPLPSLGLQYNSMPLVVYKNPDGSYFVAFAFTLAPGQTWSCLEGGFSDGMEPSGYSFISARKSGIQQFRIFYDADQCQGYNQQAGTSLPCPLNPISVISAVMTLSQQVNPMFNDRITSGKNATPTCFEMIIDGIESGNGKKIIEGLECEFGTLGALPKSILAFRFPERK